MDTLTANVTPLLRFAPVIKSMSEHNPSSSDSDPSRRRARKLTIAYRVAKAIYPGYYIRLPYPPSAEIKPRYGHGRPGHSQLSALLSQFDSDYRATLHEILGYEDELAKIPQHQTSSTEPHWLNGFLFGLDGVSLYCFVRSRRPTRYIEIGSGNSTLFVDRARRDAGLATKIWSIDPQPRREIDRICDHVIRTPLESADLNAFRELTEGDMVFMDGTHRVFMNSDVVTFFLDVLPILAPGVLVGIHDIQLPDDYRPEYGEEYYSEQYMLAAYLLGGTPWLKPTLPCWYLSNHRDLGVLANRLFVSGPLAGVNPQGVLFWMTVGER